MKKLLEAWRGDGLLKESLDNINDLFFKAKTIFTLSVDDLVREGAGDADKVESLEDEIDSDTNSTRRKIVEYLSINDAPNVAAALVLGQVLTDIERIGDLSKDILALDKLHNRQLMSSQYLESVEELEDKIGTLFDETAKAFSETDAKLADKAVKDNEDVRRICDDMFSKIWFQGAQSNHETVIYVLVFRYFRRVSEHLKNVATSVLKPYDQIGHSK